MCYQAKFIKNGNDKLGDMWTFNKLCGNVCLRGCVGSCGNCCKGCFNPDDPKKSPCFGIRDYVRRGWEESTIVKSHVRNTNAIRNQLDNSFIEFQQQIDRARKQPQTIRIHATGEIETAEEFRQWLVLSYCNPEINFYIYSKNYKVINKVLTELEEMGEDLPTNFTLLISIWHNYGIKCFMRWQHMKQVKAYVYFDGYKYPFKVSAFCPAYDKYGKLNHDKKCADCKLCICSNAKIIACYPHGRG